MHNHQESEQLRKVSSHVFGMLKSASSESTSEHFHTLIERYLGAQTYRFDVENSQEPDGYAPGVSPAIEFVESRIGRDYPTSGEPMINARNQQAIDWALRVIALYACMVTPDRIDITELA